MSRPAVNNDTDFEVSKPLKGTAGWLDDRFGGARGVRTYLLRKVYPDHWSFLLGEIALYSFIILLLTGTFLSLFFVPSMTEVTYHGSYMKLDGIKMSEAYASTLRISSRQSVKVRPTPCLERLEVATNSKRGLPSIAGTCWSAAILPNATSEASNSPCTRKR